MYVSPVTDRPDDQFFNKYVRTKVCAANKWRDLGIVLMGQDAADDLDVIKIDHPNDTKECCTRMFNEWRQAKPQASWKQLIEALKEVKLTELASKLEDRLTPSVRNDTTLPSKAECCASPNNHETSESEMSLTNQQRLEKHQEEGNLKVEY